MSSVSTELQKETQVEVWENTSQQESVFTAFLNSPKILQRTCFLFHMFTLGHLLNVKWRCFRKREFTREVPLYNWALVVQRMYNYNTNE